MNVYFFYTFFAEGYNNKMLFIFYLPTYTKPIVYIIGLQWCLRNNRCRICAVANSIYYIQHTVVYWSLWV